MPCKALPKRKDQALLPVLGLQHLPRPCWWSHSVCHLLRRYTLHSLFQVEYAHLYMHPIKWFLLAVDSHNPQVVAFDLCQQGSDPCTPLVAQGGPPAVSAVGHTSCWFVCNSPEPLAPSLVLSDWSPIGSGLRPLVPSPASREDAGED